MNILFLYTSMINPKKGGIERVTSVLGDFFEQIGIGVYYLSLHREDTGENPMRQHYLPDSDRYETPKNIDFLKVFLLEKEINIVINQGGLGKELSRFLYHITTQNVKLISVVHNSLLASIKNFSTAYALRAKKYHFKWLLPITDFVPIKKIILQAYKWKYKKHYKKLCQNSDKVLLLSDRYKDELAFFVGKQPLTNVIGMPNPCSFVADNSCFPKQKELLYVGRVDSSQKRVDLLLKVWEKLHFIHPQWSLRIVGGGNELPAMKQLATSLHLQNVFFEGFQEPEQYYKKASIFCMTSAFEGFPMVLFEAMQYGVVPVAFNSFLSVEDIIDHQQNGILVTPFDIDEYVKVLSNLINDEKRREQLAIAAIEKSKEFDIDVVGNKWVKLFELLTN